LFIKKSEAKCGKYFAFPPFNTKVELCRQLGNMAKGHAHEYFNKNKQHSTDKKFAHPAASNL